MARITLINALLFLFLLSGCDRLDGLSFSRNSTIDSLESLQEFIDQGISAGYFPSQVLSDTAHRPKELVEIDIKFRKVIHWDKNASCPPHEDQIIIALADKNQSIQCGFGNTVIISGPGNDWIDDSWGNDIILPGPGNDTIDSGHDNDVIIFTENWGHDTLKINSEKIDKSTLAHYDGSYPWEYSSFIIFGKGIKREDIAWEGEKLIHKKNGDSITLNTKNINILFASDPASKLRDPSFVPTVQEPTPVNLEQLNAEGIVYQNNTAYYVKGNDGLAIVDVTRIAAPVLLSTTDLPGRAMSVKLKNHLAFVAQADSTLEEKRGWLSIVDVQDPKKPKILATLDFKRSVYDLAIDETLLYILESHFQSKQAVFHIYNIKKPHKPKLISTTPLPKYSRYIAHLNKTLYFSRGVKGIQVFDVENPKKPVLASEYGLGKYWTRSIVTHDNKIVVNQDRSHLIVLHPTLDKKLQVLCKIVTQEDENDSVTPGENSLFLRDNMVFVAEGQRGVTIADIKDPQNCHVKATLPIDSIWVGSVSLFKNTLVAFNDQKGSALYNLDEMFPKNKVKEPPIDAAEGKEFFSLEKTDTSKENAEQLQALLYQAAANDDAEQVKILCEQGAKPNEKGHDPHNPIEISSMLGNLNALQALLNHQGTPTAWSMISAALNEQIDSMKLLAEYGGNLAQADEDGCTTLHYIAQDGTLEMVKYLVAHGISPEVTCRGNETPLTWAQFDNNEEVIKFLKTL